MATPSRLILSTVLMTMLLAAGLPGLAGAGGPDKEEPPVEDDGDAGSLDGEGAAEPVLRSAGGGAQRVPALPGASGRTRTFTQTTDVPIDLAVSSTLSVVGMDPYLWDVELLTEIEHTFSSDLHFTLTSPGGRTVTITTGNGSGNDNVFNGTNWDDQAPIPVTDAIFANNVVATSLEPEGSLAAFQGENPNGVWRLDFEQSDDPGTLREWSLRITTFPSPPVNRTQTATNGTDMPIPDPGAIQSTIEVSGAGVRGITDVDLTTFITHTWSQDLDITLTSPEGTTAVISTDNGGGFIDVFNGTLWNDQAAVPATDAVYADNVVETPLQPEGALAAFKGENANGAWTLRVADDAASGPGTLHDWTLTIKTGAVATCAGLQATIVRNGGGGTVNGSNGPDVIVVRNGSYLVKGNGGNDVVCAGGGNDDLRGGNGDDDIFGGSGADKIRGDGGTDQLYGKGGADKLDGGSGASDLCVGGGGPDTSAPSCEGIRP